MQECSRHPCLEGEHRDSSVEGSWENFGLAGTWPAALHALYSSSKQHRINVRFWDTIWYMRCSEEK